MSKVSGVCDLLDHISMEKLYDKQNYRVSDLLECFELFKKKTTGIIYKCALIEKVTDQNHNFIAENCPYFSIIKHEENRPNKASKSGFKQFVWYTYKYFDKEYTAKEINKLGGISINVPIIFNNLLDLAPYFPYTISMCFTDNNVEHIVLSSISAVDREEQEALQCGYSSKMCNYYRRELAKLYLDICKYYFLDDIENREVIEDIRLIDPKNGIAEATFNIDYAHDMEFIFFTDNKPPHWTNPKYIEGNKYKISEEDMKYYLPELLKDGKVRIFYVRACEHKLVLE